MRIGRVLRSRIGEAGSMLGVIYRLRFFRILLVIDLTFIILHIARSAAFYSERPDIPISNSLFAIEVEGSFAEIYQHIKVASVSLLTLWVFRRTAAPIYLALSFLFAWVFIDDAFQLHEAFGASMTPMFFSSVGLAEAVFLSFICAVSVAILHFTALNSEAHHLRRAAIFIVPLLVLAFFGGAVDLVHAAIGAPFKGVNLVFTVIEDGGELAAMSLACALAITDPDHLDQ